MLPTSSIAPLVAAHDARRVPAAREPQVEPAVGGRPGVGVGGRAEHVLVAVAQHLRVQHAQHPARRGLVQRRHPQRVAGERGHRRSGRALARHVADGRAERPVVHHPHVIEVAAHLDGLAGGHVPRADVDGRDLGQPLGQQAALQRGGDLDLGAVQPGVVDRQRCAVGQPLRGRQVLLVVPPLGDVQDQRDRPQRPAAGDQRDDDQRAHPQPLHRRTVILVARQPVEDLVAHDRHQRGGAGAQHLADGAVLVGGVGRIRLLQPCDLRHPLGLDVDGGQLVQAGRLEHVDDAAVGQPGDGQVARPRRASRGSPACGRRPRRPRRAGPAAARGGRARRRAPCAGPPPRTGGRPRS